MLRKNLAVILAISLLTGCTYVRYDQGSLTVIDLHPGGESIALDGTLKDRGELSVNREQGSNAEIIGAAVDAAEGL